MEQKNSEIEEQVIQTIRKLRMERNISQLAMSNILGISDGQVGNIESPRYQHKYTLKQIYTFCSYIDYPFEKIFLTDDEILSKRHINILIEKIIQYDE
ncbi:MAG: helix-turn-helix transcriptional regulator [Bacteroidales bacterium]|nr:helix-turn-helix transcriptional regulator [Bacteroidales bacterium]